jgi:hypothetical protein
VECAHACIGLTHGAMNGVGTGCKESEDRQATQRGHIDLAVRNGRHRPLDRALELIAELRLVARV